MFYFTVTVYLTSLSIQAYTEVEETAFMRGRDA